MATFLNFFSFGSHSFSYFYVLDNIHNASTSSCRHIFFETNNYFIFDLSDKMEKLEGEVGKLI